MPVAGPARGGTLMLIGTLTDTFLNLTVFAYIGFLVWLFLKKPE
jgi:hypothetical protein